MAEVDPNIKSIPLRTHSLSTPYLDTDMQSRWFDFGGDTIIRADQYVRLTSDRGSQSGWIFSRLPLTATNWEIEFEFKIHGKGNLHGDGMALWITKQRASPGPVFGSVDKFEGLGIFFDTYKNNRPGVIFPYVMAMLGDGQTSYDKGTDGKANEFAGCSARGIRGANIPTKGRLKYFQDQSLKLELQYKSEELWALCFEHGPVAIPSVAYMGFSAETGELSDNFDIISVETKNLYSSQQYENTRKEKDKQRGKSYDPKKSQKSRGWGWFFVKIVIFGILCGGGYVGYTMYRTSRRHSRFD
ncbi:hypothetical protein MMC14_002522 [Varicellaria rhodocarpa]|nr:hypothetical protein [Varicellaria rhodocarpa]